MTVRVITFDDNVASSVTPSEIGGTRHIIQDATGTDFADRDTLQFIGATVTDDAANNRTVVTIDGGSDVTCTQTGGVTNVSRGFTPSGSTILFFNATNTGFTWVVSKTELMIDFECNGIAVGPFSPKSGNTLDGDISLTALTLDGTDIFPSIAQSYDSGTEQLTITYSTPIPYADINNNQTNNIAGTFTIGTVAGLTQSTTLSYQTPLFTNSIARANVDFNQTYTTAVVTHTFSRGTATAITASTFGGVATGLGTASATITFTALNRQATAAERLLSETASFTNASNNSDILTISSSATLNPTFTFPAYLGSVTPAQRAALTATIVNNTAIFNRSGAFTSRPASDSSFTWSDISDDTANVKIFALPRAFTNGGTIRFKTVSGSTLGNDVAPFMQISIGDISGGEENYDFYEAQTGQPGAVTLFVEFV